MKFTEKRAYSGLSDAEIVQLTRQGDGEAMDYLMEKYKSLVRRISSARFLVGGDRDDLIQEGMIGLFKALRDYDCGRDASFATFAALCVSRQLYTAVQASGRKKHMPLNTAVSLNAPVNNGSETGSEAGIQLEDSVSEEQGTLLSSGYGFNPEKILIDRENLLRLQEHIESELSPFEKEVLDLHLTGMNYVEIAHILNRDEKSTDNALQRIRAKVRNFKDQ